MNLFSKPVARGCIATALGALALLVCAVAAPVANAAPAMPDPLRHLLEVRASKSMPATGAARSAARSSARASDHERPARKPYLSHTVSDGTYLYTVYRRTSGEGELFLPASTRVYRQAIGSTERTLIYVAGRRELLIGLHAANGAVFLSLMGSNDLDDGPLETRVVVSTPDSAIVREAVPTSVVRENAKGACGDAVMNLGVTPEIEPLYLRISFPCAAEGSDATPLSRTTYNAMSAIGVERTIAQAPSLFDAIFSAVEMRDGKLLVNGPDGMSVFDPAGAAPKRYFAAPTIFATAHANGSIALISHSNDDIFGGWFPWSSSYNTPVIVFPGGDVERPAVHEGTGPVDGAAEAEDDGRVPFIRYCGDTLVDLRFADSENTGSPTTLSQPTRVIGFSEVPRERYVLIARALDGAPQRVIARTRSIRLTGFHCNGAEIQLLFDTRNRARVMRIPLS